MLRWRLLALTVQLLRPLGWQIVSFANIEPADVVDGWQTYRVINRGWRFERL